MVNGPLLWPIAPADGRWEADWSTCRCTFNIGNRSSKKLDGARRLSLLIRFLLGIILHRWHYPPDSYFMGCGPGYAGRLMASGSPTGQDSAVHSRWVIPAISPDSLLAGNCLSRLYSPPDSYFAGHRPGCAGTAPKVTSLWPVMEKIEMFIRR
jgi:hypothetical protein